MTLVDYTAMLQCAQWAQDVYQDFSAITFHDWSGTAPRLIEDISTDTQLAILEEASNQQMVIVFRGSDAERDWHTNFKMGQQVYEWSRQTTKDYKKTVAQVKDAMAGSRDLIYPEVYGKPSNPVKMHRGFMTAYLSVREAIHEVVSNSNAKQYRIVGHSLGGAIAKLCAVDLQYNFADKISVEAYTFGAPKVGNKAFVASYNARVPKTFRVVNGQDAVAALPRVWQGYRHSNTIVKLKRAFTWRLISGRVIDHRLDNYIKGLEARVLAVEAIAAQAPEAPEGDRLSRDFAL